MKSDGDGGGGGGGAGAVLQVQYKAQSCRSSTLCCVDTQIGISNLQVH